VRLTRRYRVTVLTRWQVHLLTFEANPWMSIELLAPKAKLIYNPIQ